MEVETMPKFAWLLLGFGLLMLLTRGHIFPFFFGLGPFLLLALLFGLFARGPWAYGGRGPWRGGSRGYYWRGRHGYYSHQRCGASAERSAEHHDEERSETPRANTGDTVRL
jgi:hypothetical protein